MCTASYIILLLLSALHNMHYKSTPFFKKSSAPGLEKKQHKLN